MWNWFNCYLSGRHDYGVWCEPGAVYLRCVHCGKRSSGWTLDSREPAITTARAVTVPARADVTAAPRVLPFERAAAQAGVRN